MPQKQFETKSFKLLTDLRPVSVFGPKVALDPENWRPLKKWPYCPQKLGLTFGRVNLSRPNGNFDNRQNVNTPLPCSGPVRGDKVNNQSAPDTAQIYPPPRHLPQAAARGKAAPYISYGNVQCKATGFTHLIYDQVARAGSREQALQACPLRHRPSWASPPELSLREAVAEPGRFGGFGKSPESRNRRFRSRDRRSRHLGPKGTGADR